MIKWKQNDEGYDNYGLDFGNPDFVKYAESYGAKGYRVEKASDLEMLLEKTLKTSGVHVIDCEIDYSENQKVFDEELAEKKCPD